MIKLIPEQMNDIEERLSVLNNAISEFGQSDIYEKRPSGTGAQGFDYLPDFASQEQNSRMLGELKELSSILQQAVVIEEYDSTKINIGTKFSVKILEESMPEIEEFILIEKSVIQSFKSLRYVSISAPLGAAVYGKHVNESFSYRGGNGKIIKGIITSISLSRDEQELHQEKTR